MPKQTGRGFPVWAKSAAVRTAAPGWRRSVRFRTNAQIPLAAPTRVVSGARGGGERHRAASSAISSTSDRARDRARPPEIWRNAGTAPSAAFDELGREVGSNFRRRITTWSAPPDPEPLQRRPPADFARADTCIVGSQSVPASRCAERACPGAAGSSNLRADFNPGCGVRLGTALRKDRDYIEITEDKPAQPSPT